VTVVLPRGGLSMIDSPGGPFWWPEADLALFAALVSRLRPGIEVIHLECNINDPVFAERCARALLDGMHRVGGGGCGRGLAT
jgi:uncharacterized protein (UPF0261 family)